MPASPHAPPDHSGYVAPKPDTFNNPFTSEEFGKEFDEAFAKDEAIRSNEKKPEAIAPATPPAEPAKDDKPVEAEKPKETPVVPEVKSEPVEPRKGTKEAKAFAEMRTKIKALEQELEKRPATAPSAATAELEKKLAEAIKERDAFSEKLMQVDVEKHPTFQTAFTQKLDEAIATTKEIVGPEVADRIEAVLKMPIGKYRQEQIDALAETLTPYQLNALAMADITIKQLSKQRDAMLSKPKEIWQELQAREKEQIEKQIAANRDVFNSVLQQAESKEDGVFAFQEREGDTEWNQAVKDRKRLAEAIYTGELKPQDRARAAAWAASAPALVAQLKSLNAELEALKAENESLKGATPKVDGGGGDEKNVQPEFKGDYVDGVAMRAAEFFQR